MPATVIGIARSMGLRRTGFRARLGGATFAIAFERIARQRCCQEQQIVKVRHAAFRAQSANFIQTARGRALDVVYGVAVDPADSSSCRPLMLSILLIGIGMPVIQTLGGRHALNVSRILGSAGEAKQALTAARSVSSSARKRASAPSERTWPRT